MNIWSLRLNFCHSDSSNADGPVYVRMKYDMKFLFITNLIMTCALAPIFRHISVVKVKKESKNRW